MSRRRLLLAPLMFGLGCGGATSGSPDTGVGGATLGGASTGGTAATATGGAVSAGGSANGGLAGATVAVLGAATLAIGNSTSATAGYGCGAAHQLDFGQLDALGSASSPLALTDGLQGAAVSCTLGAGSTYEFSGELSTTARDLRLAGTIASATGTGTAIVHAFDPVLQLAMGDADCTIQVTRLFPSASGIAAELSCRHLTSIDDAYLWCALSGLVAFSGCGQ